MTKMKLRSWMIVVMIHLFLQRKCVGSTSTFTVSGSKSIGELKADEGLTKTVTVTFPEQLSSVPIIEAWTEGSATHPDTFETTVSNITTVGFVATIRRTDALLGWGQNPTLHWTVNDGSKATQKNTLKVTMYDDDKSNFLSSFVQNGTRYRLSIGEKSHEDAMLFCNQSSSILLEIDSQQEQKIIDDFIQVMSEEEIFKPVSGLWIGLKLDLTKLTGVWNNVKPWDNSANYSNFAPGQPDGTNHQCIQLWKRKNWKWDNTVCSFKKQFICENPVADRKVIEDLARSIIEKYPKNVPTTDTQINKLTNTMNDLMEASSEDLVESDQQSLSETIYVVENALQNYDFEEGDYELSLPNIQMEAIKITNEPSYNNGVSLGDNRKPNTKSSNALIDENLLQELFDNGNEKLRLTSVVYRRPDIFKGAEDVSNDVDKQPYPSHILTNVLSVSVGGMHVSHLSSPLQIISFIPQYTTNKSFSEVDQRFSKIPSLVRQNPGKYIDGDMRYTVEEKCAFWDFSKSSWSDEGCRMESENQTGDSKEIKCSCDHMTHFAVILDLEQGYFPKYLDYLTLIGCCISIICILITMAVNLYFTQLRTKLPQQILINICAALLLINLNFVVGIDRTDEDINNDDKCFAFTILLHYSVLLLWAWLLVEGTFLFRLLIYGRFHRSPLDTNRFFILASFFSYIIPLLIVVPTASILERSDYQSEKFCWLARDPMLFSILIPIGIVLFANICIFSVAMYIITCGKKNLKKESSLKEISVSLRRAMCMLFALGIPWIFGYMMLLSPNQNSKEIFAVLFSLFNSLQGAAIFFFYCAYQKNVQKLIREKFQQPASGQSNSLMRRLRASLRKRQMQRLNISKIQQSPATRSESLSATMATKDNSSARITNYETIAPK